MLRHLITTTSENKVQEFLSQQTSENHKVFVLTTRIPDDAIHIRYDVFKVERDKTEDS